MYQALGGHLVDERDRLTQRVGHGLGIFTVDRGADVAQRAAKTGSQLAVVIAALDVLAVRFERGFVTGHSWIDPCNTWASGGCPERVARRRWKYRRNRKPQILAHLPGSASVSERKKVRRIGGLNGVDLTEF